MTYLPSRHNEVWINSMGKKFLMRAVTTTDAEANEYMAKHSDTGIIAIFGDLRIMANLYEGEKQ